MAITFIHLSFTIVVLVSFALVILYLAYQFTGRIDKETVAEHFRDIYEALGMLYGDFKDNKKVCKNLDEIHDKLVQLENSTQKIQE